MGQSVTTKDGRTWHYEPGALFLDFVYTGDLGTGDPWWERLRGLPDLDDWLARMVCDQLEPARPTDLRRARALRLAMSTLMLALAHGRPADERDWALLAREAARPDVPPSVPGHPTGPWPATRALATLARDAVIHLRDHAGALRICAATDCPLVFLDLSRSGSRQWCSMARCGNRAKVRAFTTRHSAKGKTA